MKITIVHNDNKKQLLVSTKTMEKLLERIAKDDSKQSVTRFRDYAAYIDEDYRFYKDMPTWMHIYPAAEFAKDENSNLKMKICNGILLLKFNNITDPDGTEGVKRSVAILPSTFAALESADGKSVIVLVKFTNQNDKLPTSEPLRRSRSIASPTNRSTPSTKPWSRHRSPSAPRLLPSRLPLPCRTSLRCTTVS